MDAWVLINDRWYKCCLVILQNGGYVYGIERRKIIPATLAQTSHRLRLGIMNYIDEENAAKVSGLYSNLNSPFVSDITGSNTSSRLVQA